jgi:SAM-dependent methyltransferase
MIKNENNTDFHFQIRPQMLDRFDNAGVMEGAYFNQDLLVAQKIFTRNPTKHIDIGSRIDGFVAHVASFRKIKVFDIRKIESTFHNIEFEQRDIMNFYPDLEKSCDSISSLHAIEHFGLGRYGDPININGHTIAIENIYHYLKTGGIFYFSVPIGKKQRIEFNAHRVFSLPYLLDIFKDDYELKTFSYVDDSGILFRDIELSTDDIHNTFNLHYGCGIFELVKK